MWQGCRSKATRIIASNRRKRWCGCCRVSRRATPSSPRNSRELERNMSRITSVEQLEALYGQPSEPSLVKEVPSITPHYRTMIETSPFAVMATAGPEGLDCSPRGDVPGFVRVKDERTLLL